MFFFEDLGIKKPKIFLNVSTKSALNSIGEIISKTEACLDKHKPDAFLILGDTNSCLSAISAKKKKVPIFIWKLETDALIKEFQRKLIER